MRHTVPETDALSPELRGRDASEDSDERPAGIARASAKCGRWRPRWPRGTKIAPPFGEVSPYGTNLVPDGDNSSMSNECVHEYDRLFMADPLVIVADLLAPAFPASPAGWGMSIRWFGRVIAPTRRPTVPSLSPSNWAQASRCGRRRGRRCRRRRQGDARGGRTRVHQRHVRRGVPARAAPSPRRRRAPRRASGHCPSGSSSTTRRPTSPRRCTSGTCARR